MSLNISGSSIMKTVILAGGLGTRLSEYTKTIPKPMVAIRGKPILVHIMEQYWNNVRISQVIGRARRIKSHIYLPEEQRNVSVFNYNVICKIVSSIFPLHDSVLLLLKSNYKII